MSLDFNCSFNLYDSGAVEPVIKLSLTAIIMKRNNVEFKVKIYNTNFTHFPMTEYIIIYKIWWQ